MEFFQIFYLLLVVLLETRGGQPPPISDELYAVIEAWAPLVWLHSQEVFFPSSIDFFFRHVDVRDSNETLIQGDPDRSNVVTGPDTSDYHLNSVPELVCADCLQDWFAGQDVSQISVPTYVYVREYGDPCSTVDVAYRAFYPYNFGKNQCIGLVVNGTCEGLLQSFGNHVGDWEHYSIRLRNLKVEEAYVSVHSFGAWYRWNDTTNNFQFTAGEESRINLVNVTYPETVEVVQGFHAEVFSANGSHGLWSELGIHEYVHFPIKVWDDTERGMAWKSWENMEIVAYGPDAVYGGSLNYLDYHGKWGNLEQGCQVEVVSGECVLGSGPTPYPWWPSDFGGPSDCPAA